MTKEELFNIEITAPSAELEKKIKGNWDSLSKPIDGMGDFEGAICRLGAIQGKELPTLNNKAVLVMCADNGIVNEGVTQAGKEVTAIVAGLLGAGKSTLNVLAARTGAKVIPVDVGIDSDSFLENVCNERIRRGTRDFLVEEAMTEAEVLSAIYVGINKVKELSESGIDIIATGEMGIGNTSTTSALLSLVTGINSDRIIGRGAGLSDLGFATKLMVVERGLSQFRESEDDLITLVNVQDDNEIRTDENEYVRDVTFYYLRAVGGLDIAALVGVYIGGAIYHVPIVIDGSISATAGLLAELMFPGVKEYMIPSHKGREAGTMLALERLGLKPYINGDMALGEGTGAVMLFPLLDMALDLYSQGTTFKEGNIEQYERFS